MAAIFADSPEGLVRSSGIRAANGNFTLSLWIYVAASISINGQVFFYRGNDPQIDYTEYVVLKCFGDGHLYIETSAGTADFDAGLTSGWHCLQYTYTASTGVHRAYVDGVLLGSLTASINALTFTHEYVGTDSYDIAYEFGKAAQIKEWSQVLTQAQLVEEAYFATPVLNGNVWLTTPLDSNLQDESGNGRHWSESGGTIAFASASLPYHATGATDVPVLPQTITLDAPLPTATNLLPAVWVSHRATAGEILIGAVALSSGAGFEASLTVWFGEDPDDLTQLSPVGVGSQPIMIPVTAGIKYWFRVKNDAATPSAETLTLRLEAQPTDRAQGGDIFVPYDEPNDADGTPARAILVDPNTGAVRRAERYVACERAAVLPNGISLAVAYEDEHFYLYSAQRSLLLHTDELDLETESPVTSDRNALFYVGQFVGATGTKVSTVSATGVIDPERWTIPVIVGNGVWSMVVSRDNTTLVYAKDSNGSDLDAWDLINDVSLGTWAPGISNHRVSREMLNLSDGTFIVAFEDAIFSDPYSLVIRHYASDGTQLHEYTFESHRERARLAFAQRDVATSFWLRRYDINGDSPTSHWSEVNIADGVELRSVDVWEFNDGVGPADGDAGDDPPMIGPAQSCPYWILEADGGGDAGGGGGVIGAIGPLLWIHMPRVVP